MVWLGGHGRCGEKGLGSEGAGQHSITTRGRVVEGLCAAHLGFAFSWTFSPLEEKTHFCKGSRLQ